MTKTQELNEKNKWFLKWLSFGAIITTIIVFWKQLLALVIGALIMGYAIIAFLTPSTKYGEYEIIGLDTLNNQKYFVYWLNKAITKVEGNHVVFIFKDDSKNFSSPIGIDTGLLQRLNSGFLLDFHAYRLSQKQKNHIEDFIYKSFQLKESKTILNTESLRDSALYGIIQLTSGPWRPRLNFILLDNVTHKRLDLITYEIDERENSLQIRENTSRIQK